jgi:hypothetical protein
MEFLCSAGRIYGIPYQIPYQILFKFYSNGIRKWNSKMEFENGIRKWNSKRRKKWDGGK